MAGVYRLLYRGPVMDGGVVSCHLLVGFGFIQGEGEYDFP